MKRRGTLHVRLLTFLVLLAGCDGVVVTLSPQDLQQFAETPVAGVSPVLSFDAIIGGCTGGCDDYMRTTFGMDMSLLYGFGASFGVRFNEAGAFSAAFNYIDATASGGGGYMPLDLLSVVLRADAFIPLAQRQPGLRNQYEFALSALYVPWATLLDNAGDGWRNGSAYGFEVAFCHRPVPWTAYFFARYGVGCRFHEFREFEVGGVPTPVSDSLNTFYFFAASEWRF